MVSAISLWPELTIKTRSSCKEVKDLNFKSLQFNFREECCWSFGEFCLSILLLLNDSFHINVIVKADKLFLLAHSIRAHPLNPASSCNSSCSFDSIPLSVSLGFVSKMPHLFCYDGLPTVMQEFPRLACLLASPPLSPFFTSLCLSKLLFVISSIQQFSHIYPLPSVSHPSVYSRLFVLFLPWLSQGHQKAGNLGQAGRRPIKHSFPDNCE